jgi:hypothetical protein
VIRLNPALQPEEAAVLRSIRQELALNLSPEERSNVMQREMVRTRS